MTHQFILCYYLNAAIADNLHYHIDRVWQETMLDFAQQKQSLFHIAKTYGIKNSW